MCNNKRGLTLIELMVALFILALIVGATFAIYVSNLRIYKSEAKTAETQMSKILALELLRRDLVHAGYGLPWTHNATHTLNIYYQEATGEAASYNDTPNKEPRAFCLDDNAKNNADYLVIKSIKASENEATRKWGLFTYDGTTGDLDSQGEGGNFTDNDYVIFIKAMDPNERELFDDSGTWYWNESDYSSNPSHIPQNTLYLVYGVSHDRAPRMPFNRVDYYLDAPAGSLPDKCYEHTFLLYRATIDHADGQRNPEPILDCVKDFQVVFGVDNDSDPEIDDWTSTLPNTPEEIRNQVKEVRVFILYQEGQKSDEVISTTTITLGDNDTGPLSTFTPAGEERHYRWKILKIAVRPLNLGT